MKIKKVLSIGLVTSSLLIAQEANTEIDSNTHKIATKFREIKVPSGERKTKTGILTGIELGLGGGVGKFDFTIANGNTSGYYNLNSFELNTKIFGGYQKYFNKNETIGFNVRGNIGFGYLNHFIKRTSTIAKSATSGRNSQWDGRLSHLPLSFGVEANFLYDFWEMGEQTIGVNIGLGYSFIYGVYTDASSLYKQVFNKLSNKNLIYSLISPKIGIHYYYNRHQIEFNFIFDKAVNNIINTNQVQVDSNQNITLTTTTTPNFYYTFNLGYAYRF